jgi:UDP-N-acetylglucosamine 2-epimerase (non-hydrolysing)
MSNRFLIVVGTRPEVIKMAPVYLELKTRGVDVALCNTEQQKELTAQSLSFFEIVPDFELDIMSQNQSLDTLLSKVIQKVSEVILSWKPTHVLVQGDTSTVLGTALAGFHNKVKLVHVEAGLRSFNLQSPFPEEMNRVLTSKLANVHFCPTELSLENLRKEDTPGSLFMVGNTVIDSLLWASDKIKKAKNQIISEAILNLSDSGRLHPSILVTSHRRENFGDPLNRILKAILAFSQENPKIQVIFPVHPNPNVKSVVENMLGKIPNILLLPPLDYPDLVFLMEQCDVILTDSGGIQEEAPTFKKPVLVLRENTERPEGVAQGNALLVGSDTEKIKCQLQLLFSRQEYYDSFSKKPNPYGNGTTAKQIADIILQ